MYSEYREIFSKNLRYYMFIQNKKRNDISNETGIPYTSIRDYEKGICCAKEKNIELLANYFNIPKEKLIEKQNETYIMDIINNSKEDKLLSDIIKKLPKLNSEQRKFVLNTIDMITNDKQ